MRTGNLIHLGSVSKETKGSILEALESKFMFTFNPLGRLPSTTAVRGSAQLPIADNLKRRATL